MGDVLSASGGSAGPGLKLFTAKNGLETVVFDTSIRAAGDVGD